MTHATGDASVSTKDRAPDAAAQVAELERVLAERHKTPQNVEQFGVEAVPRVKRTTGFWDLFGIQLSFQINNLTITLPGLAVLAGLNLWAAIFAQTLGVLIVFLGYAALSTYGAKYGIPGQVGTRFAFGVLGSKITASLMRAVASAYWFAWQTLAAALGLQIIFKAWLGVDLDLIAISVVFAVLQALVALTGWESLKYLTRVILPLKVIILGVVIIVFLTSAKPEFGWSNVTSGGTWDWVLIATWAGVTASSHLSMYTDAADLSRYARTPKTGAIAFYLAAVISTLFCGFIGAVAAKAVGGQSWFQAAAEVQPYAWMFILLLIVLVADNWFINIMNLYTGGFAIVNIVSRIGRFWATVICAAAGIGLSTFAGVYENTPAIVTEIGYAFAPVGGILLAHYVVLSRWRLDLVSLYNDQQGRYRYLKGINPIAIVVGIMGYLLARSLVIPVTMLSEIAVVILTGAVYAIVMTMAARFWTPAKESIDYRAMKDEYDVMDLDEALIEASVPVSQTAK